MRSKVICFASAKGGSGKTIISATLAKFLAGLGKKVLLVDMDAATNGLSLFYLDELVDAKKRLAKENVSARGIFEVPEAELPTPFSIDEATDMIPATYVMKQTEGISEDSFRRSISETLSGFRDKYDYIILDAQAGSDIYAQIAIENADEIVIVSEYDPISAEGVERLKRLFPEALSPNKTWILFNKILPEFARSLGDFLVVARYLSPVPWDAEVVRAFARRRLAINMESGSDHTLAIMQTAHSLLGKEIEEEMNRWKQDKEELIREPARSQLKAIEEEMSRTEQAKIETEYQLRDLRNRPRRFFINLVSGMIGVITVVAISTFLIAELFLMKIILTLFLAILASIVLSFLLFQKKIKQEAREKEKKLEGQARALDLRLEDLKERRQKYRTLVESDLETLLKKRGY